MKKDFEQIIVDIITHELNLPENYGKTPRGDVIPCVIVYSQNIKLFNTEKLQITVQTISAHDYSNRTSFIENPNPTAPDGSDTYLEVQDLNQSRMMQIDIYSRNNEARNRFWEVTTALKSVYAQQQMDLYNFKLGTITNTHNNSGIDGGSDINRYSITFNAIVHYEKKKPVNYYDKFQGDYYTEQGKIGQINIGD